jgi:heat-inducible transcriptional repressor
VQKYSFNLSPATMRNIMFDLESAGYLMQPHTSAGRVPTDRGFRFYVDSLMEAYEFKIDEMIDVHEEVLSRKCSSTRCLPPLRACWPECPRMPAWW